MRIECIPRGAIFSSSRSRTEKVMQLRQLNFTRTKATSRAEACRVPEAVSGWQPAILDALPAHVALLDADGVIVATNLAWRRFAEAGGLDCPDHGIGASYLEICDRAAGEGAELAHRAAEGIRSVLSGAAGFSLEYPCHSSEEMSWFLLSATPLGGGSAAGAVIMHVNITERRRAEDDLRQFANVMDNLPDAIFMIDRDSMRLVYVNEAACRLHALERAELLDLAPWSALNVTRAELESDYDSVINGAAPGAPTEGLWRRRHGTPLWIEIRRHAQLIGGRRTIVSVVRDVSARKEADRRIAYLNRVYAVLSRVNTLIVRVRHREELFAETCRLAVDQGALAAAWIGVVDRSPGKLVAVASAGIDAELLEAITRRLNAHSMASPGGSLAYRAVGSRQVIVSNRSNDDAAVEFGTVYAERGIHSLAVFPLVVADRALGVLVLYAREPGFFHEEEVRLLTELTNDVAFSMDHIEKQERLDYLAFYDVLTGLANRTLFLERTEQYLRSAESGGHKLALCLFDVERFRNVNNSLGRAAGDALLRQLAQGLMAHAGGPNLVARIDADRFAVLLPRIAGEEDAARHLEACIGRLSEHSFDLNDAGYRVALKIGVASFPGDGGDAETLCKHAEAALKKAKSGGNRYVFYDQKMTDAVAGRLSLESRLRRALELGEYELHYQPKIELATGRLVGAEALLRWNDPGSGLVAPGDFIPVLEETGLIHEVGRWALGRAIDDYLSWRRAGLPAVRIAVNLSPRQLQNRDFVPDLLRAIAVDAEAPAGLELELTETLIMDDVALSTECLGAIRASGVRIAIDDFGTGFSSLSYLSKLPVDTVKIDRSFVVDMAKGPGGMALISIIINLAHSLKLRVVAEGVETGEQARLLRLLGCDDMQGFLMSRPLPAGVFAERFLAAPEKRPAAPEQRRPAAPELAAQP
jgi:diguanylate cyclase (GGDEF)-like protein/PAS domain S-box-containing protein